MPVVVMGIKAHFRFDWFPHNMDWSPSQDSPLFSFWDPALPGAF